MSVGMMFPPSWVWRGVLVMGVRESVEGREVYSFSRLDTSLCLKRYRFKYVDGLPEPVHPAAELGSAVHRVIQQVVNRRAYGSVRSLAERLCPEVAEEAASLVEPLFRGWRPSGVPGRSLFTERYFLLPLDDRAWVHGYIDLLELGRGTATVTDFKSGWRRLDVLASRQLGIYAWAVREEFGVPMVLARYWFLRNGQGGDGRQEALFGPAQIEDTVEWVRGRVALIRRALSSGEFPASPGRRCGWCDWPDRCLLGRPLSDDPADLAGVLLALEPVLADARERVKAQVAREPLEVDGEWFGMYPRTEWSLGDLRGFFAAVKGAGQDPAGYLVPHSRRLWGLFNDGGPAAEAVSPYVRRVENAWFRRGKEPPPGVSGREVEPVRVEVPPLPDDSSGVAGRLLVMEAVAERAKAALRRHVEAGGPLRVGDVWFGVYPWTAWEFSDVRGFFRAAAGAGLDPARYVEVDGRRLWREFREETPVAKAAAPFLKRRVRCEFDHRASPPAAPS